MEEVNCASNFSTELSHVNVFIVTLSCDDDDNFGLSWYSWVTNRSFCLVSITIRIQGRAICHPLYTSYAHLGASPISKIYLNFRR